MRTPNIPGNPTHADVIGGRHACHSGGLGALHRLPRHASRLRHGLYGRLHRVGVARPYLEPRREHSVGTHVISRATATPVGTTTALSSWSKRRAGNLPSASPATTRLMSSAKARTCRYKTRNASCNAKAANGPEGPEQNRQGACRETRHIRSGRRALMFAQSHFPFGIRSTSLCDSPGWSDARTVIVGKFHEPGELCHNSSSP